jgi:predicted nucleic acid-binding protein
MVLADTPIWSLALRRRSADLSPVDRRVTQTLSGLIVQNRVQLLGVIRQEVLSGIREATQFTKIRDYLREFPDIPLASTDYEEAAQISNECRRRGIATSMVDMLMCSVSLRQEWEIFTTDRDFTHYAKVVPLRLLTL